jgi:hypothetical protein
VKKRSIDARARADIRSPRAARIDIRASRVSFVMMPRRLRRGWSTWAALVLYALVGLVPARGLVLCIGEDGHVALEAATALASCFDCPAESQPVESCCSDAEEQGSSCSCTDFLLQADNSIRVRTVAVDLVDLPPPSGLWVDPTLEAIASLTREYDFHVRWTSPPCPRVPTNLILRV